MVSLQCKGMYGYEYLLKEIAQHYKTKVSKPSIADYLSQSVGSNKKVVRSEIFMS